MKLIIAMIIATVTALPAMAGQVFNEQVAGVECEMVEVMSDLNPGKVRYTYRADPTCANVRTTKEALFTFQTKKDKLGNVVSAGRVRVAGDENNGG